MRLKDWLPFSSKKFESQENVSEEKSTVAKKIHRKGTKSGKRHQPHIPVSCLKMARRKRYARSDVVIFIPATFVGVLFACDQEYAPVSGVSRINSVFDQPSAKASVEISSSDGSEEVLPNAEKLTHSPGKPFPAKKHYRVLHRKKITKRSLKSAPQEDSPDSDAEELDAEEPYSEEIPFLLPGDPCVP
ncbi:hypothetical protein JCM33374_g2625 [Metschnikowia sp. JCM 33374]|nr:hypothetical protein JCM33374_g2625 [Metschnikowia sp. JCM 33374]